MPHPTIQSHIVHCTPASQAGEADYEAAAEMHPTFSAASLLHRTELLAPMHRAFLKDHG